MQIKKLDKLISCHQQMSEILDNTVYLLVLTY